MDRGAWRGYHPWGCKELDTTEQQQMVQVVSSRGEKKNPNSEQVSDEGASLVAQLVKNPAAMRQTWVPIPESGSCPGEGNRYPLQYSWASLVAQLVSNRAAMQDTWVPSLGGKIPSETGTAIYPSILAWRIPWAAWSTGSQRVGHDWATHSSRSDEEGLGLVFIHGDSPRGCP